MVYDNFHVESTATLPMSSLLTLKLLYNFGPIVFLEIFGHWHSVWLDGLEYLFFTHRCDFT